MIAVADTNALIWYIYDSPRLTTNAREIFEQVAQGDDVIGFSSISLAEIVYLEEANRIPEDSLAYLLESVDIADPILAEVPFDRQIAQAMPLVERAQIPDLPDRIISATAIHFDVPLITSDRKIRSSNVETLW
ncbi:MAG: type II toxin-antitoxin system VapC family toxin [Chloroflexi bacterium]|nr:type II toxin-antitoxin system VapC family toxin [Chloroflexota bacterium]